MMAKIGRYTAALVLIIVGVMLFIDQSTGSSYMLLLIEWWPILLITLGAEFLIFNFVNLKAKNRLRLDIPGLMISLVIAAVAVGFTHPERLPMQWLNYLNIQVDSSNSSLSSQSGYRFDKDLLEIPYSGATDRIMVSNPNGSVTIKTGELDNIQVETTIWVDRLEEKEAAAVAERSVVEFSGDRQLRITARGEEYTGGFSNKRKPMMDLIITVPNSLAVDYQLNLDNGKIEVHRVAVHDQFQAITTNGSVSISEIDGNVAVETTNAKVDLAEIEGNVTIESINGAVVVTNVGGSLTVDTVNGSVETYAVAGNLEIDTVNGSITARETGGGIVADSTNGSIVVHSNVVGGDYSLNSVISSIQVTIPENADVKVNGSTLLGSVRTDLALTITNKKISGVLGTGQNRIDIDTNGSIQVNKLD